MQFVELVGHKELKQSSRLNEPAKFHNKGSVFSVGWRLQSHLSGISASFMREQFAGHLQFVRNPLEQASLLLSVLLSCYV